MSIHEILIRQLHTDDVTSIKQLIDTTINTTYAMFPLEYRQHWIDEHHTLEQIITDAAEGYTLVIEYQDQITRARTHTQSVLLDPLFYRV